MNNDRLCAKRWNYASVNLMQSSTTTCCLPPFIKVTKEDIEKYGTDAIVNSKYLKTRRYEMFKGIEHDSCKTCWKLESQNAPSMRGNSNKEYCEKIFDKTDVKHNLETMCANITEDDNLLRSDDIDLLEISIGNTCDLKCIYCSHHSSSQWALEKYNAGKLTKEEFKEYTSQDVDPLFEETFWNWFDTISPTLNHVNIKGGEPLIIPYFYTIMEKILERPHLNFDFTIITNLNTDNNHRLDLFFDYLIRIQKVCKINVYISMESIKAQAEYIRSNLNWKQFEKNVHRLAKLAEEYKNIRISFMPTINMLSLERLPEFLYWIISLVEQYDIKITCKTNMADGPFNPLILPSEFAQFTKESLKIIDIINNHYPKDDDWINFKTYIEKMHNIIAKNSINDNRDKFLYAIEYLDKLDIMRKTGWKNNFPAVANLKDPNAG